MPVSLVEARDSDHNTGGRGWVPCCDTRSTFAFVRSCSIGLVRPPRHLAENQFLHQALKLPGHMIAAFLALSFTK
jgi:hypothetical protein